MSTMWDVPAYEIREGDVIRTQSDDVTVVRVEPLPVDAEHYPGGTRVHGRITRGYGKGKRVLAWSYHADHVFPTVERN